MAEMDALERSNQSPPPPPAPAPAAPAAPAPAPIRPPGPTAPPLGAAVVSFVHSRPGAAPPISSAPTIPMPAASIPVATRRASSEFDAVEKDFFAREPEPEEGDATAPAPLAEEDVGIEADLESGSDPGPREP